MRRRNQYVVVGIIYYPRLQASSTAVFVSAPETKFPGRAVKLFLPTIAAKRKKCILPPVYNTTTYTSRPDSRDLRRTYDAKVYTAAG